MFIHNYKNFILESVISDDDENEDNFILPQKDLNKIIKAINKFNEKFKADKQLLIDGIDASVSNTTLESDYEIFPITYDKEFVYFKTTEYDLHAKRGESKTKVNIDKEPINHWMAVEDIIDQIKQYEKDIRKFNRLNKMEQEYSNKGKYFDRAEVDVDDED